MNILMQIWTYFANNILKQPAYMIGLIVMIGYILLGKKWYDVLAGVIKAIVGYLILAVGSGGLVSNFRPVLVGLKDRFNMSAMVIDPYFGQNAVTAGVKDVFGKDFGDVMILLLIAFIVNIILVRFNRVTKLRSLFTTGHVQVQQAATAYWLIAFACPFLLKNNFQLLVVMALILGAYWAVGSNLTIKPCQELTDGAGFCLAHQQMFGVALNTWLAEKLFGKSKEGKKAKRMEDIELPGFMSIFNENMVCTSILMIVFFGAILCVLGKGYLTTHNANGLIKEGGTPFLAANGSMFFYVLNTCLQFSVYLAILQLGVRTFVAELTNSFQGIANKLLPGSIPGVDCAVTYGFGAPNAVPIGFLMGFLGQLLAIIALIILKSPVLVICGFVPVFFDNATIALFANEKGGVKAALILPFLSGIVQVFGSALIAGWVGMAAYGGYLGMWDWATVWPVMTVLMKYLSWAGIILIVVALLVIPHLQYRKDKEGYFLMTEDWEAYKKHVTDLEAKSAR
jgi:PTS system ascorbate-specific IIC component